MKLDVKYLNPFRRFMQKNPAFMRKFLIILVLVCSITESNAQIGNDKWNITGELALPMGMGNKMFRNYLNGIVTAHPKIQYKPFKHWYVAFGPRYMYYKVNEYRIPFEPGVSDDSIADHKKVQSIYGGMHVLGGDIELGWTSWVGPRLGLELGVKTGIAQHWFNTSGTKKYGKQDVLAMYVEPTLSIVLASDEAVAYRWIIGYNFTGYHFDGYRVGSTTSGGYTAKDLRAPTQSLIVGFAISYYFKNQRSDVFLDEP
ncbi:hypothetical protein Fluta_0125 [Fluviicola taffensis DSM 16823]|uniref:Outer membrane protein beta-barrel domain-containing protein n=2 Tax=Fluviicola TaxID=332102 RepID=F2IB52_FLUTR|nr:hypothetical protein Fluta_0125 [Fluviicola taffensis DSM 16823]